MRTLISRLLAVVVVCGGTAAAGCDPCAGVVACRGDARLNYEGEVVLRYTDIGVEGTRVDFIRTGGVETEPDSVSVMTNQWGLFTIDLEAAGEGEVIGDIVVYPPLPISDTLRVLPPYRVPGLKLQTTSTRGEARFLQRWVADPYLDYALELVVRETGAFVPAGALVKVSRVSGAKVEPDTFFVISGPGGRVPIAPTAHQTGGVVFDLEVLVPDGTRWFPVPNVQLRTIHTEGETVFAGQLPIGTTLGYVGELFYEATGARAQGVEVEFRQTGGPELLDPRFTARTDQFGRFPIMPRPVGDGEITADLIIRPPAPFQHFTIPIKVSPSNSPRVELLGVWGIR